MDALPMFKATMTAEQFLSGSIIEVTGDRKLTLRFYTWQSKMMEKYL